MRKAITVFALVGLICMGTVAQGAEAVKGGPAEAAVKAAVQRKIPQLAVESVTRTSLPGIYEVFGDGQIIYVDESVTHVLSGSLFNVDKNINLTQESMSRLTAIKFDQLPLNLAFRKVKGNGSRKMAYFADPNCGYCKRIEQDLAKLDNVTIYIFLYPVLGPDSVEKAKAVWCTKDKVKAWDNMMLNGVAPAPGKCDNPVDKIVAFGNQKKITGTPTLFFADGQRVPGAIPLEQIEQRLVAASQAK